MSVTSPSAGDDILATFGQGVADFINSRATITANTSGITTTQTQVVALTIAANTLTAGRTYRLTVSGTITSTVSNAVTMRARIGTTTLTGNIITSNAPSATTTASADGFTWNALVTVRSTGASGTIFGESYFVGSNTQPFTVPTGHSGTTATVVVDTTVQNILEATIVTGAGTTTVTGRVAFIELISQ